MYAPARDWAWCLTPIIERVAVCFKQGVWPIVFDVVQTALGDETGEETAAELFKANDAYAKFAQSCTEQIDLTIEDALRESGFLSVHPAAQVGYLAMLAQIFTGNLFEGLRDVTPAGETPAFAAELERLMKRGIDSRRILNGITKCDDLKTDLATIVRMLRNEQTPWDVIERIVGREKALDPI